MERMHWNGQNKILLGERRGRVDWTQLGLCAPIVLSGGGCTSFVKFDLPKVNWVENQ